MQNLTRAHDALFNRHPDERFSSMSELSDHCYRMKLWSVVKWVTPEQLYVEPWDGRMSLGVQGALMNLNSWSFSQLCSHAGISKDTVNRLSPETATQVFLETWPTGSKPFQVLGLRDSVRSIHRASYTRLYNTELLSTVREFAVDFVPPQQASSDLIEDGQSKPATGLYCGEQDLFAFLIDPTGWIELGGQAFAPGFFVWNSEVGRRSVGIQTFWYQSICNNHIVWDAVNVAEYTRKHTTNVHRSLREIRRMIERMVEMRDQRRDAFAKIIKQAMTTKLGDSADDVMKVLQERGIQKTMAKEALKLAEQQGKFTVFSLVDALTRLAGQKENAGDRTEADIKGSSLLALVA